MNDIPRHEKLRDYMPNVNDEYLTIEGLKPNWNLNSRQIYPLSGELSGILI